jgi:hypothetical protein
MQGRQPPAGALCFCSRFVAPRLRCSPARSTFFIVGGGGLIPVPALARHHRRGAGTLLGTNKGGAI